MQWKCFSSLMIEVDISPPPRKGTIICNLEMFHVFESRDSKLFHFVLFYFNIVMDTGFIKKVHPKKIWGATETEMQWNVISDVKTAPVSNGWTTTLVGRWQTLSNFNRDQEKLENVSFDSTTSFVLHHVWIVIPNVEPIMDPRYDIPRRAAGGGGGSANSSPALAAQSRRKKIPPRPADFKLQIIIIGSRGVGKTSLMERYTDDTFCEACKSTVGAHGRRMWDWFSPLFIDNTRQGFVSLWHKCTNFSVC